jgi:hypothetical protein
MPSIQREQNPDVNSIPSQGDNSAVEQEKPGRNENADIERPRNEDIPVPPDNRPVAPIEEPPDTDKAPVGDVDDSPKRIAGE